MPIRLPKLPKPVAEYFAAERAGDAEALARCFVEDGVVRRRRDIYRYRRDSAMERNARAKYHHTVEPLSVTNQDGAIIVVGRVAGTFPGSPLDL
jgi:hypothetical protein